MALLRFFVAFSLILLFPVAAQAQEPTIEETLRLVEAEGTAGFLGTEYESVHLQNLLNAGNTRFKNMRSPIDPGSGLSPQQRELANQTLRSLDSPEGIAALKRFEDVIADRPSSFRGEHLELQNVWGDLMKRPQVPEQLLSMTGDLGVLETNQNIRDLPKTQQAHESWWAASKLQRFGKLGPKVAATVYSKVFRILNSESDLTKQTVMDLVEFANICIESGELTKDLPAAQQPLAKMTNALVLSGIYTLRLQTSTPTVEPRDHGLGIGYAEFILATSASRAEFLTRILAVVDGPGNQTVKDGVLAKAVMEVTDLTMEGRFPNQLAPNEVKAVEQLLTLGLQSPDLGVKEAALTSLSWVLTDRLTSNTSINPEKRIIELAIQVIQSEAMGQKLREAPNQNFLRDTVRQLTEEQRRLEESGGPIGPNPCAMLDVIAKSF